MRIKNVLKCTTIALLLIGASGTMLACTAQTAQQESAGQYVDSSSITAKVKAKLLADKTISSLPITVTTYKSNVQLSGFVNSKYQKQQAETLAYSVPGVESVDNALIVK